MFQRYRLFETDRVRLGKLIEDFDALAADIAYRHLGVDSVKRFIVVTAAMDRLDLRAPVTRAHDLVISGSVCSVGATSLEVRLLIETEAATAGGGGQRKTIMQAIFSMVCRDHASYAAAAVPRLVPVTAYDRWAFEDGAARRTQRRTRAACDLKNSAPTPAEIELVHRLHRAQCSGGSAAGAGASAAVIVAQQHTVLSTVEIMHGQERNVQYVTSVPSCPTECHVHSMHAKDFHF